MPEPIVIGIDVAKASLAVAVHPSAEAWSCAVTAEALDALAERLKALQPVRVVLEASGGYEMPVVAVCTAAGLPVCRGVPSCGPFRPRAPSFLRTRLQQLQVPVDHSTSV